MERKFLKYSFSWYDSFIGTKVLGTFAPVELFHGTKVLGTFAPEERKFHRSESSKERMFHGTKVLSMVFSLLGTKVQRNEKAWNRKKLPFSHTAAYIFVYHGDAPAIMTQYVAWMERQFNACQTPRNVYLSIFNSFRIIGCLSQCLSPKIPILHFCFPWGRPWDNHAKCCMDGKRIRCLQIVSLHVPI